MTNRNISHLCGLVYFTFFNAFLQGLFLKTSFRIVYKSFGDKSRALHQYKLWSIFNLFLNVLSIILYVFCSWKSTNLPAERVDVDTTYTSTYYQYWISQHQVWEGRAMWFFFVSNISKSSRGIFSLNRSILTFVPIYIILFLIEKKRLSKRCHIRSSSLWYGKFSDS